MGRPKGNGLIELVDEKSKERGFFCMQLVSFINKESKEQIAFDSYDDLWQQRFSEARAGQCAYRNECHIYARTMAKKEQTPIQLSLQF